MNEVACKKCGKIHFEVDRNDLENRERYGNMLSFYQRCSGCGTSYRNFRETVKNEAPLGVTLTPILARDQ